MELISGNLLHTLQSVPDKEVFEPLLMTTDVLIERIISHGQTTPENEWYDQERDEWVVLLQGNATIRFSDDTVTNLTCGDYLFIPAHCRHRVEFTQTEPPCIWLAIHGKLTT
jgi:cupin 2 domain-containing protein